MLSGPFKKWRHLHRFSDVNNNNNNKSQKQKTEVIDEINFELPYGRIGRLFDRYACRRLQKVLLSQEDSYY
ncbi:MAG: hypothetical protein ACJ719_10285 [Nitrososphaeraceae archaeon]